MRRTIRTRLEACLILAVTIPGIPAQGQEALNFSDLEGLEVAAKIVHDQVVRREGQDVPVKLERDVKVVIGPGDSIPLAVSSTVQSPRGKRQGKPASGPFTLGQEREIPALGGGSGVFTYGDGALTFVRTFKGGAFRSTITFARSAEGFTCTVKEGFAREGGTGAISLNSPTDGTPITIVRTRQSSSYCTAKKG
jgi:hypothetical protein